MKKSFLYITVLFLFGCQQSTVLPQIVNSINDISYNCSEEGNTSTQAFENCKLDGTIALLPKSNPKYEEYVEEARERISSYAKKRDQRKLSKKGWDKKRDEIYEIMLTKISMLDEEAIAQNKRMQKFGATLASGMRQQADYYGQQSSFHQQLAIENYRNMGNSSYTPSQEQPTVNCTVNHPNKFYKNTKVNCR